MEQHSSTKSNTTLNQRLIPFKNLSIEDIQNIIHQAGLAPFRAEQILTWVYGRGAQTYDEMTDLPSVIREQFTSAYPLTHVEVREKHISVDGSRKYLLQYSDDTMVEVVGLPSQNGRLTVCCSSQAGCAIGCEFCATGKAGFTRNLTPGEIVEQAMIVAKDFSERVSNVVMMGQGEPFLNYKNVLAALRIMNHPKLLNIGARHITVSTCGVVEGIQRFSQEPEQFTLAVSLHAARQSVRDTLISAMASTRLGALRQALVEYTEITGRRCSLEYALIQGVNDSNDDLQELINFCTRLLCHVNLIPLNKVEGFMFNPASLQKVQEWEKELSNAGIAVSIRRSRGTDIAGACGQLIAHK